MKKLIVVFAFLLFACGQENRENVKEEKNVVQEDWMFLNGVYGWGDALNACPVGYHLPDESEWEDYIARNSKDSDNKYWTSSYSVRYVKDYSVVYMQNRNFYHISAYERKYSVACKKDEKIDAKAFADKTPFYGTAYVNSKYVDCINGRVYVGFEDNVLYQCKNKRLKKIANSLEFLPDSLNVTPDTVVLNMKHMIPCTFGLNGKNIMTGYNFYMYQCYDNNWHGLGYVKLSPVQLGYFRDSLTGVHFKTITIDSMEWSAENIQRSVPGEACYENKKMNCEKYGRLYGLNAQNACPNGWRLPRKRDWVKLFGRFGLNGSYLRSKDDWFLEFRENNDVGFSADPAGYYDGEWTGFSMEVGWWSYDDENRLYGVLFNGEKFGHNYVIDGKKYYVRCVRNVLEK